MRQIELRVNLYKSGTTVFLNGRPDTIDHNIVRGDQLFLKLTNFPEIVSASMVQVTPTYYKFETVINESN